MKKKYKQLSLEERTLIQTQLSMRFKPTHIARELGRSASTICRELRRHVFLSENVQTGPVYTQPESCVSIAFIRDKPSSAGLSCFHNPTPIFSLGGVCSPVIS